MISSSPISLSLLTRILAPAFVVVATACSSAAPEDDSASANSEALSTTIHSEYGMTTFGGPGDYQNLACGGNSRTSQEWYVASSQRYGCHVHLQLTANGKCVVVQTEDAGPATYVETRAGIAILDSSPAVAKYLFNTSGLGYSDVKDHPGKYDVRAVVTNAPLGPCSATSTGSGSGSGSSSGSGTGSTSGGTTPPVTTPPVTTPPVTDPPTSGTGSTGGSTESGTPCSSDGQCNPGSDGSGQICVSNVCVDGCNADWECPGSTSCSDGLCQ